MRALLAAIYNATFGTAVRYRQEPTAAAGVAIADDSAWDQIIAGTVLTADHWLCGLNIGTPAGGAADTDEVLAEGIGGADGATTAAATLLVEAQLCYQVVTAAGEVWEPPVFLPVPILCGTGIVANGTRHAAEISTSTTGGAALTVGITYMSGLAG